MYCYKTPLKELYRIGSLAVCGIRIRHLENLIGRCKPSSLVNNAVPNGVKCTRKCHTNLVYKTVVNMH